MIELVPEMIYRLRSVGPLNKTEGSPTGVRQYWEMADAALCVVVSATPKQIKEGLDYELRMVDSGLTHRRVLLVLGPWRKRRLWEHWCANATAGL